MAWIIGGGIFLVVCTGFFLFFRRKKFVDPINMAEENSLPQKSRGTDEEHYLTLVFLASWIIEKNARGRKEKLHLATHWLKERFAVSESEIITDISRSLSHSTNIRSVCNWIRSFLPGNDQREEVLHFVLDLAFADGDIIDREYVAIARFCELIGVRLERLAKEVFKYRDQLYTDADVLPADLSFFRRKALHTLGLEIESTSDEIRKAYRRLVVELHPDKLQGVTDEERKRVTERFLAVRDAYEFLARK